MDPQAIAEIKNYTEELKSIQRTILNFIEDESEENIENNMESFNIYKNPDKKQELKYILYLLGSISTNHYQTTNFFGKIEKIILNFEEEIKQTFSNFEIFNFFNSNKMILLFLLENQILILNKEIAELIFDDKYVKYHYREFFSPEISKWKSESQDNVIRKEILIMRERHHYYMEHPYASMEEIKGNEINIKKYGSKFEEMRKTGQNDLKICELIRNDSIDEFIVYIEKNNIKHTIEIEPSVFESNSFLNEKKMTLIEYAAFFGSIRIFQFLQLKGAKLTPSLIDCAIHSNNPELIQKIEDLKIESIKNFARKSLIESIKCHHIDIFNYLCDNYMNEIKHVSLTEPCLSFYNLICFPDDDLFNNKSCFLLACKYDYFQLVKLFLKMDNSVLNKVRIYTNFFSNSEKILVPGILIQQYCLQNCETLKSLKINSSVKSICPNAFRGCVKLTSVSFEEPSTLNIIDELSFAFCYDLTQITIPSSVEKIAKNVFNDCRSLTQIKFEIPSSLTHILFGAFSSCALVEITIPSSVTFIGESAFCYCESLQKVYFTAPSSVSSIESSAFHGCNSLTTIELPPKITSIENNLFTGCKSLVNFIIPPSITQIKNESFERCSSLVEINIPSSVTSIGSNCFDGCTSLTHITIPSSITSIEDNTFENCKSLEEIKIPSSVKSIGKGAFKDCTSLKIINIPSSVESIGKEIFKNCTSLNVINIPSSITSIEDSAFSGCTSLTSFKILSTLISIGEKSFEKCSSLKEIVFDSDFSLQTIGNNCFENCSSLVQITFPSPIQKVGSSCFRNCSSLKSVEFLSSHIPTIESCTFFDCSSLEKVVITSPIIKIDNSVFKNCKKLLHFEMPPNVTTVGFSAFENCSLLDSLNFPSTVKSIGNWNFNGCTSLKEITIPSSVDMNFNMIPSNIKVNKI